jgi:hypothetical protein
VTVATLLIALALAATPAAATSGLYGTVIRGPVTPVCRVDVPCYEAAAGVTLVFERAGRPVTTARTNASGRYRVALAPGRYIVRTRQRSIFERVPEPSSVTVPRGRFARVNFAIDTGIR